MKRLAVLAAMLLALASLTPAPAEGAGKKALTLMIYMCGSNLESQYGSAYADIEEMRASGVDTEAVNVLLLTGGSAHWHTGQGPDKVEVRALRPSRRSGENRWAIEKTLAARSMGDAGTLADFLGWGTQNYPAEKYALILWDHGAGPLEGICLDELNAPDRLGVDELARALERAKLQGKLSWIGMDACLMATAEVAKAVSPYAEYMIASQETEPADGWDYAFLKGIEDDRDGAATGRRIVDSYFESQGGDAMGLTLSCLDLSHINEVTEAMNGFFEPIGRRMNNDTFARLSALRTQSASFGKVVRGLTADGYDLVDLGDLINHYGALGDNHSVRWALESAVTYKRPENAEYSGLSVYHPLRNKAGYRGGWKQRYAQLDFSEGYKKYLNSFGTLLTGRELADWSGIALSDDGFNAAGENLYSLQLTPLQRENFASAQCYIMGAYEVDYKDQVGGEEDDSSQGYILYPVSVSDVEIDDTGLLTAKYHGNGLYITDGQGKAVAGPIAYCRSEDGNAWYFHVTYRDNSGRWDAAPNIKVLYTCRRDMESGFMMIEKAEVFDEITETYTRRIGFSEADYTDMWIDPMARILPQESGTLPGLEQWVLADTPKIHIALPMDWHICLYNEQLSGTPLFAVLQVISIQQEAYCTLPIRIKNPNLFDISVQPNTYRDDGVEMELQIVRDTSQMDAGLSISVELRNISNQIRTYGLSDLVLNHSRSVGKGIISVAKQSPVQTQSWNSMGVRRSLLGLNNAPSDGFLLLFRNVKPGETVQSLFRIDQNDLAGLGKINMLSMMLTEAVDRDSWLVPTQIVFHLRDCDVTGLVESLDSALCTQTWEGATWRLVSLDKSISGGLVGVLHIVNHSDTPIVSSFNAAANGRLQFGEIIDISVPPHMDTCLRFELSNGIVSDWHNYRRLNQFANDGSLYCNRLMEQSGIRQVESLCLLNRGSGYPVGDICFVLDTPVAITSDVIASSIQAYFDGQGSLLMDGDITVLLDRVQVKDGTVVLRLKMTNHLDRGMRLEVAHVAPIVDGSVCEDSVYSLNIGAYATAYDSLIIHGLKDLKEETLTDIALAFRCNGEATDWSIIQLEAPVALGAEGDVNLLCGDFSANVAVFVRSAIDIYEMPLMQSKECLLTMALEVDCDDWLYWRLKDRGWETPLDSTLQMRFSVSGDNLSEMTMDFKVQDIVLNDKRSIGGDAFCFSLKPGKNVRASMTLKASDHMKGLEELNSICLLVSSRQPDNSTSTFLFPFRCETDSYRLLCQDTTGDALAQKTVNNVTWKLMAIRQEEALLAGNLLVAEVCVSNGGTSALDLNVSGFSANGVRFDCDREIRIPQGTEKWFYVTFFFDPIRDLLGRKTDSLWEIAIHTDTSPAEQSESETILLILEKPCTVTIKESGLQQDRRNWNDMIPKAGISEQPMGIYEVAAMWDSGSHIPIDGELEQVDEELEELHSRISIEINQSEIDLA